MRSLGHVDFFPYVYAGVILLNFITKAIVESSEQIYINFETLRRINVPAEVFIISKVLGNLVNFIFGLIPLAIYFVLTMHPITLAIICLPFVLFPISLFIMSFGIVLSIVYIFFTDLKHLIPIFMTIVFYVSPVFYSIEMIGGKTQKIVKLNPLNGYLNIFRSSLNVSGSINLKFLSLSFVLAIVAFLISLRIFEKYRIRVQFVS